MSAERDLPPVLAIFGPTAGGKTAVAEAIAERVPAGIVSADALQVYRGLPILTNQSGPHVRLVGIWPLDHEASVAEYQRLAHAEIDELHAAGRLAVVAGGTGLYLRAALSSLEVPPPPAPGARERLDALYERLGPEGARARLAERDPATAAAVHANDRRRIVRALELAEEGHSLRPQADRLWSKDTRVETIVVGLDVPKDELERRIAARTTAMWNRGVEEEVRAALAGSLSRTARAVLGLDEIASLGREEAQAAIVTRTRRYAAYQRKWMRRIPGLVTVRADRPAEEVADEILKMARTRKRLPARRAG